MKIQWRQQGGHFKRVIIRLISGRPLELTDRVMGSRKATIRYRRKGIAVTVDNLDGYVSPALPAPRIPVRL